MSMFMYVAGQVAMTATHAEMGDTAPARAEPYEVREIPEDQRGVVLYTARRETARILYRLADWLQPAAVHSSRIFDRLQARRSR
jgi:hypothetical protein